MFDGRLNSLSCELQIYALGPLFLEMMILSLLCVFEHPLKIKFSYGYVDIFPNSQFKTVLMATAL